jgi:hypothetical protein
VAELSEQVDLDNINFFSNRPLEKRLNCTTSIPEQVAEAMCMNAAAASAPSKSPFFAVGSVALLVIFPLRQSPDYKPGKVPGDELEGAGEKQLA